MASAAVGTAYQVGLGKSAPGQSYPAIFIAGSANSTTGSFRSDDGGDTWTTISDAQHQYGPVGPIVGDRNVYGRCYIGAVGMARDLRFALVGGCPTNSPCQNGKYRFGRWRSEPRCPTRAGTQAVRSA